MIALKMAVVFLLAVMAWALTMRIVRAGVSWWFRRKARRDDKGRRLDLDPSVWERAEEIDDDGA